MTSTDDAPADVRPAAAPALRIGMDARYAFRSQRRGIGEYVTALLRHLPAVAGERDEFVLYVDRQAELDALTLPRGRFRVRRLAAGNPLLWEEFALPLAARRDRLDLLHLTSNYGPSIAPCPTVYTILDLIEFIRPQFGPLHLDFRHWAGRAVRTRTLPRQARRARRVITISEASKLDLVHILGLRADRIDVTLLAAAGDLAPAGDAAAVRAGLRRAGYALPERYVLALGALDPRKNGPFVARAFHRIAAALPDAGLVIAGVERLAEYPLPVEAAPGWLRLFGYVDRPTLVALLQGATAFVYPSLYEGFGLPVLEAMACGVPVLASNRSSIPEVAGDAGALFDPTDEAELAGQLVHVLTDEQVRLRMRRAGLVRAASFSWLQTTRQTYATYRAAAGRPDRPRGTRTD